MPILRSASYALLTTLAVAGSAVLRAQEVQGPTPRPQPSLTSLSLEELGRVEVTTVSKEPEQARRVPAAIFVISQEDIRRSGATSLPEILRLAPGLDVAQIDGDHWSVGVRGFGDQFSKSVLVMIDGRSVYTPLFAGIDWPVQDTPLQDIERIEIIRGPGGTIWGANAVNGVINIITKNAKDTPGSMASAGTGTTDRAMGTFRYGGGRGDNLSYRVYAKGFDREPQFHTDGHAYDSWQLGQGGFRADWAAKADTLTVQGDIYNGSAGQSVGLATFSPPAQITSYDPLDLSGGNLVARWRRDLGGGRDVQLQAYYDRTRLLGPQIGEVRNTFDVDLVHHLGAWTRHDVLWGAGMRISPSELIQTVPSLDLTEHDHTSRIFSLFAQDEITLVERRVWLTVGSKVEHNEYTGVELQPSARVLWTPTDTESVWAAVTRAVRTPSRLEDELQLYGFLGGTTPTFVRIVGNKEFNAETLVGTEAGYRRVLSPQLYVDVSTFFNHHDNLESFGALAITVDTTPPPPHITFTFPYANGVTGTSAGFEIAPDWKPTSWWQLKGSYSYLHIDLENRPGNTDAGAVTKYEGSSPRHQVAVQSLLDLPAGWQVDATLRHVSELPALSVSAYSTADVRLGWQINRRLELSVAGRNLLQANHVEFAHDPGPMVALERSVFASLVWRQ